MRVFIFIFAVLVTWIVLPSTASAQYGVFGGPAGLDPHFCKQHNIRQTVIYADDTSLIAGKTGWMITIYDKLKATLVPGELVTVVELSPASGQSSEIWHGCWPSYTAEERRKLQEGTYILSPNPLSALDEQQKYFARDLGAALNSIEQKNGRPASAITIDPENPPQKSLIRALASDGARYAHANNTVRAIIYSDLAENSDLGSVFKPLPDGQMTFGDSLGTYLRRSVFYAFGVGTDIKGGGKVVDTIRMFWIGALRSMAANVNGLGSDLSVPNTPPIASYLYDIALVDAGQNLSGRLSLLVDSDGLLVDSWIGIPLLSNASLNGTFRCQGADEGKCVLQANTIGRVVSTAQSESVTLSSRDSKTMTGMIGVKDSKAYFPMAAAPATE